MFKNYLKIAIRNTYRNKVYSFINIAGLAIGMTVCIIILQYVSYENSYDKFHEDHENIYRVQYNIYVDGVKEIECAAAVPAVGPAMKDNFPEVLEFARAFPIDGTMSYEDKHFRERRIQIATPSFIKILSFPLVRGNPETALNDPFTAVITEEAAKRYFGNDDPIGKTIIWNEGRNFEITGVCKDVPDNSHIKFSFLFSYQTLIDLAGESAETAWGWYDFNTYVLLQNGIDHKEFDGKFNTWLQKEKAEEWEKYNGFAEFFLQPIASIHLYSDLLQESEPDENGDGQTVRFLTIIAVFILILAWVNYINLSTSKALQRAKEVGIRKVVGASRRELIQQFLFESIMINIIAAIFSIILVELSLPFFSRLTGVDLAFTLLKESGFWRYLIALFTAGALISGFYPAFVLSSFQPVTVLKGVLRYRIGGFNLRKLLVVFQFAVSIALIAGTIIVLNQLSFMRNKDIGIDIEQTLVIHAPRVTGSDSVFVSNLEIFRDELKKHPEIHNFTAATNVPGDEIFWAQGARRADQDETEGKVIYIVGMDYDYIPSFDLKLIAGRNFSRGFATDDSAVIINRSAVAFFGYESPEKAVGEKVIFRDQGAEIVGVIEDYNQMGLKTAVKPLIYPLIPNSSRGFYSVKLSTRNITKTIAMLQVKWGEYFPGNPFDYFFLDDFFDRQYHKDRQFGKAFGVFSALAIFIAGLGLFALASLSTIQRTKEIGIRKVLGASVQSVLLLLSKDFIKLIILSNLIAILPTYFVMNKWLESFVYRININFLTFVVSGVLAILIALFTIGYQAIKSATANPVKALKYE